MSGQSGRGRGGRGGRGASRANDARKRGANAGNADKATNKKHVDDYIYFLGSVRQAADYETTTAYLTNHIMKTFSFGNDVATALTTLQPFDLTPHKPKLQMSTAEDRQEKAAENEQFKMEFLGDYDAYKKRQQALESNMTKAYAFLWTHCAKAMQHKIEGMTDFSTVIDKDPIELLKAIKKHALSYQENRYEMSIISDSLKAFVNLKQKEGESLQDYTKRFKTSREVLETHMGGHIVIPKIIKSMADCDEEDLDSVIKCGKIVSERWMAFQYLEGSDKTKYGSILRNLQSQHSLGNNQYPTTVAAANQVLSNHRFDEVDRNSNRNANARNIRDKDNSDAPAEETPPILSFAQLEGKCYCCGKGGHKSPQCKSKSKPKEEWAINKAKKEDQSHATAAVPATTQASIAPTTNAPTQQNAATPTVVSDITGWIGMHTQFFQGHQMKDVILLDNQSTTDIFCNPTLVENIRKTSETLTLATNAGNLKTDLVGDVPGYGTVWFHPKALTNIFSFANMSKKHPISYHQQDETFIVQLDPNKKAEFKNNGHGLYYFKPTYKIKSKEQVYVQSKAPVQSVTQSRERAMPLREPAQPIQNSPEEEPTGLNTTMAQVKSGNKPTVIDSVEENKNLFTPRQVEQAKLARKIYHALGTPSVKDFKAIITMNAIKNLPITLKDVDLAEQIFGPDIGALKGKTTRSKPFPVVEDYIEIPPELIDNHQQVTLCMDGMKINGIPFLTTISRNIMYRTVQPLPNQTSESHRSALETVFGIYNRAGFSIKTIHCDNEFQPLVHPLTNEFGIGINYSNPQEHVPEAERNIRVVKERFRASFHRLPFTKLPRVMVQVLAMECAKKLNFFPPKGGISPFYSPRMILHQANLDFSKHCSIPFGTYVQAHQEPNPTNAQHPRTLD